MQNASLMDPGPRREAPDHIARVYRNPSLQGAFEALSANFPATRRVLGEVLFEAQALDFARSNPPCIPIPALYGHGMADWLATRPLGAAMPFLRNVARCDELAAESNCAAEAPSLQPGELEIMPISEVLNLRLRLHPSARFEWMGSQGVHLWQATGEARSCQTEPHDEPAGVLFTRRGLRVRGYQIDRAAHRLLAGIRLGEMLGAAAQAASTLYPEVAIARCFEQLVARAAFVSPAAVR